MKEKKKPRGTKAEIRAHKKKSRLVAHAEKVNYTVDYYPSKEVTAEFYRNHE